MPTTGTDLQESLILYMRTLGAGTGINWGATASPYYKKTPDNVPVPTFPYVILDIPRSSGPDLEFESGYEEDYEGIAVRIVGNEANRAIFSPYVTTNLFFLLDTIMNSPSLLSGANFKVNKWLPGGYEVTYDSEHGPNGEMVLIAERLYAARVLFNALG